MYSDEHWKSNHMLRVELELDDAVERAYRDLHAADDLLDRIAADDEQRAAEAAEACREYAHRDDVSPAWKAVVELVDDRELTWHDIASGAAMDHPAMSAAIADDARLRAARDTTVDHAEDPDEDTYYDQFTVLRNRRS